MKNIGISQRVYFCLNTSEIRDCLDQNWFRFGERLSVNLIPVPNVILNEDYLNEIPFDGFILSGGNNISNENINNISKKDLLLKLDISIERDLTEIKLINHSLKNNLPMIGICRGMQMINSFFKGTLVSLNPKEHVSKEHYVYFEDPDFSKVYGNSFKVNSFHNYGISQKTVSKELKCTGSYKESVECFKHCNHNLYGLMWHPERSTPFFDEDVMFFKNIFNVK